MQVIGVNTITKSQSTRRVRKASADSVFSLDSTDAIEVTQDEFEIESTNSVSSLLAIHNFKEKIDLEKRSEDHSESLLRNMDEMLRNLAQNNYSSTAALSKLTKTLGVERQRSDNYQLEELVDEVELLALVEAAKLRKMDKQNV
ncbi:MAG: flagellar assembly protein FliX [Alphaproteobacteria bacterium]|jgi:hypothetical protein|nr:hypothetical protein [Candidatus Jidaibacter sp.]